MTEREYDRWMGTKSPESLDHIAAYNEDDVRATHALRDWLVGERPNGTPWRAAHLELDEPLENHDEQIEALHAFGPDTPEALLGDLLEPGEQQLLLGVGTPAVEREHHRGGVAEVGGHVQQE